MTALLTAYVLMWPVIVAGILFTIAGGFARDVKKARDEGRPIICPELSREPGSAAPRLSAAGPVSRARGRSVPVGRTRLAGPGGPDEDFCPLEDSCERSHEFS